MLSTLFMIIDQLAEVLFDQLAEVLFVRFHRHNVFLCSLPHSTLYYLERSHYVKPTLEEWGIMLYPLGKRYVHKSFGILHRGFVYSPHLFVYSLSIG